MEFIQIDFLGESGMMEFMGELTLEIAAWIFWSAWLVLIVAAGISEARFRREGRNAR